MNYLMLVLALPEHGEAFYVDKEHWVLNWHFGPISETACLS